MRCRNCGAASTCFNCREDDGNADTTIMTMSAAHESKLGRIGEQLNRARSKSKLWRWRWEQGNVELTTLRAKLAEAEGYCASERKRAEDAKASADHRALVNADLQRKLDAKFDTSLASAAKVLNIEHEKLGCSRPHKGYREHCVDCETWTELNGLRLVAVKQANELATLRTALAEATLALRIQDDSANPFRERAIEGLSAIGVYGPGSIALTNRDIARTRVIEAAKAEQAAEDRVRELGDSPRDHTTNLTVMVLSDARAGRRSAVTDLLTAEAEVKS